MEPPNKQGTPLANAQLLQMLEEYRAANKQIVFTNGCFDILHVGHVRYLQTARTYGDCLLVGLNSDRSTRELKGPTRPIVPETERAEMLLALSCVDAVMVFDEPTPEALITLIRPDVHVKGGDYRADDLPETTLVEQGGGKVVIAPLEAGKSTTNILARIRSLPNE